MKVVLRTLCGCSQVLDWELGNPVPDTIDLPIPSIKDRAEYYKQRDPPPDIKLKIRRFRFSYRDYGVGGKSYPVYIEEES